MPFIYGLIDPLEVRHVRYVGMAMRAGRPYDPAKNARRNPKNTHLFAWIRSLQSQEREPTSLILEELPEDTTRKFLGFVEKCYIRSLREIGHRLTNVAEGGDGGNTGPPTPETLAKIYASWTPEKRAKQSRAKTGNKNCVGRVCSPETREKQRIAHLGQRRFGRQLSQESKDKQSAGWTPEKRTAHSAALIGSWTPERRARYTASRKGRKRIDGKYPENSPNPNPPCVSPSSCSG